MLLQEKIDGCLDGASNNISTLVEFETPELQLSLVRNFLQSQLTCVPTT